MASSNPKTSPEETEEETRLKAELQRATEEKKAVFETTREADEKLRKIREKEERDKERLLQISKDRIEKEQRERYAARLEAQKKPTKQEAELRKELEAVKMENDRLKYQVAALSKGAKEKPTLTASEMDVELLAKPEVLRFQNEQLKAENFRIKNISLELKGNLQRISREQRTTIRCLKDMYLAAQQKAVETQLRQLSEAEDKKTKESEESKQLKPALTTLLHHQQHQQRTASDKYIRSEYLTICSFC